MDGTHGITQCAIQPNTSFTYNFTLTQSGTYWYHNFSMDLLPGFFAPGNEGVEPVPDNGLINGYRPLSVG